jgi:hypothetical protein
MARYCEHGNKICVAQKQGNRLEEQLLPSQEGLSFSSTAVEYNVS